MASWYKGPCLLDVFDKIPIPSRDKKGPLRLPILDSWNQENHVIVTGKLENGRIDAGKQYKVEPLGKMINIVCIYNSKD